jgi:hypothetical protein
VRVGLDYVSALTVEHHRETGRIARDVSAILYQQPMWLTGMRAGLVGRASTRVRGPRAKSIRYRRADPRNTGQGFGPLVLDLVQDTLRHRRPEDMLRIAFEGLPPKRGPVR